MDISKTVVEALQKHTQITAAGLCCTPGEIAGGYGGDVDIFVYCTDIPSPQERRMLFAEHTGDYTPGESGGRWGICDLVYLDGEEVWLMYVTEAEALSETKAILSGSMPDRLDNYYYPVGRLATIKNINALYDRGSFLESLKKMAAVYPERLAQILIKLHSDALLDTEDLTRAAQRGDVLFYHFALDLFFDHFLQALFALNRVYFPGRKRSIKYIGGFNIKPDGCEGILLDIVKTGSESGTLGTSFGLAEGLIGWMREQANESDTGARKSTELKRESD